MCEKYRQYKTNDNEFNSHIITHFLMGTIVNEYTFGLSEKIYRGIDNLKNDIFWLINNCILEKNMSFYNIVGDILNKKYNPEGIINITYIKQDDYKDLHRSGWQYVVDNLTCWEWFFWFYLKFLLSQ